MQLNNLKMIVTGGAKGMGRHFAESLLDAGAQVAVGDIDSAAMECLPAGVHRRRLDVSSEDDIRDFVRWAADELGGINGLINNAGVIRDGLLVKRDRHSGEIRTQSTEDLDLVLNVNLRGATLMVREVAASMIANDARGVIVNMSSISRHGNRGQTAYVAAKAALAANTQTWSSEFSRYGIRVGAIAPGMIQTPMTSGMKQAALDALTARIPVGRIGVPEDIWLAVRFILECDYFTGRTIDVDGGLSM